MTALAAVLAAGAVVAWARPGGLIRRRLGGASPAGRRSAAGSRWRDPPASAVWAVAVAVGGIGVVAWGAGGVLPGAAVAAVWFVRGRRRRVAQRRSREADVAEACVALSTELAAGLPVRLALDHVAAEWPELFGPAAARAALGGAPAAALRAAATRPGAGALGVVAAAWEVSERTGAALSALLLDVADSLRAEAQVRREAQAQLASVRATARILAVLPVATLALFSIDDGGPLRWLVGDAYGIACLALAAVLVALGLGWVDRMVRPVTRSVWDR